MIPQKLTLKNFLSYRDATLDFSGLHTACICGPNGAGKSSLLEAIAWAIWGNSRSGSEDDIIHLGEIDTRVDFTFISHDNLYRIIRSRRRGQSGALEFQVATNFSQDIENLEAIKFKPLTERGMRVTQQKILDHLKLDYETFINSAYLRQGRADEFMIKRPTERKEILASLLKLDEYDGLSEKAKDTSRQYKGKIELLEQTLESTQEQLLQEQEITQEIEKLEATLTQLQDQQNSDRTQLQTLQTQQYQRQSWEKLLSGQQQQYQTQFQDYRRIEQELSTTQQQLRELQAVLLQEAEIQAGYLQFQTLQTTEETLATQFKIHQEAQQQLHRLQEQQQRQLNEFQRQLQTVQTRLEGLNQQEQDYLEILNQKQDVEAALTQLQLARTHLNELDQLQLQVTPLLQQRQKFQTELERVNARQSARLEELNGSIRLTQRNLQQKPHLEQQLYTVDHQISELDKKRIYQQRVQEKGQKQHSVLQRLGERQREYEAKLTDLERKILLLGESPEVTETEEFIPRSDMPLCPLCDRPLDEHLRDLVISKHRNEQQDIRNHLWVVQEELAVSEQEIQRLREEYRQLMHQLSGYEEAREQRGKLQAQLDSLGQDEIHLQRLLLEAEEIERSLSTASYGTELNAEIQQLDQQLQVLNYSEQSHALARNEEKRWRWAEVKISQIRDAEIKLTKICQQKPELEAQIANLQQQILKQNTDSEIQSKIVEIQDQIAEIGYNLDTHNRVRNELRQGQIWLTRREKLNQAQLQSPVIQQRIEQLKELITTKAQDLKLLQTQIEVLQQQLESTPNLETEIQSLEQKIQHQRQVLDEHLGMLGRLKQQKTDLENLKSQQLELKQKIKTYQRQYRVYQELSAAFGKNGIQALMIENVLPQLEAETNNILSRLSANQLHIQFVTQRAGKSSRSSKKTAKMIDTLDILIADAKGTRPYETYSGGEAFRINFAIRLALAKLLAQRAGTALQLLIIDEGFGTQDAEGCDRLISSINAIAPDFSCILTVTHIPYLKEAFQARIEVHKTPQGSQLRLSI